MFLPTTSKAIEETNKQWYRNSWNHKHGTMCVWQRMIEKIIIIIIIIYIITWRTKPKYDAEYKIKTKKSLWWNTFFSVFIKSAY